MKELSIFLDPFMEKINDLVLLREIKSELHNNQDKGTQTVITQMKSFAVVSFVSQESMLIFAKLYNNLQFPSYRYYIMYTFR